ncbi:MAG: Fe-S cluster assembly ATPase SufC [Mycoplasmatales bacterium]
MSSLIIKDLYAQVEGKKILKGVNLTIKSGEIHVIMGPNGTGKSTLAEVVMGNPKYEVISGSIKLEDKEVLEMEVDERAREGLFLAMQYPAEIAGITNSDFIRGAMKAQGVDTGSLFKYIKKLEASIDELKMAPDMSSRYLNQGFSGGEKKRNEILQMKMLKPKFAVLDEIDSGLDIDALTIVGQNLTSMMEEKKEEMAYLIITHYQRLLNFIKPTHVHIMLDGKIVESGGFELVANLETNGYDDFKAKYNITEEVKEQKRVTIDSCATHLGVTSASSNE